MRLCKDCKYGMYSEGRCLIQYRNTNKATVWKEQGEGGWYCTHEVSPITGVAKVLPCELCRVSDIDCLWYASKNKKWWQFWKVS